MSRFQALIQERAELVAEGKGILAAAEQENRALTPEEAARDDAISARLEAIGGELGRIERDRERQRTVEAVPNPNAGPVITQIRDRVEDDRQRGFANLADFALSVRGASMPGGMVDERLRYSAAPTNYHQETGSSDGYMVPPAFREAIWELVFNGTDVLGLVTPEPTSGNQVELLADETTPWGATGVQAYWRSEGSQMTASRLSTEPRTVKLHELYALVLATGELLADAPRLNDRLTRQAARAIRYKASNAIVNGTGVGQPLGWFNSGALVTQAKEGSQTADTINATNIVKMFSRLQGNIGSAVWLINQDAFPQLPLMTIGNQPVYMAPNGLMSAPGGLLLGRPVLFCEHCATLGDLGDIQLVDPSGYYAVNKAGGGLDFASSIHLYFDYNVEAFRWLFRFGGQPYLSTAVSPDNGSNTRSHFVVLQAR